MFLFDLRIYHASFTVHLPQIQQVIYIIPFILFSLFFLKIEKSWYIFSAISQKRKVLPAPHLACSAQNIVQSPSGLWPMHIFNIWLLGFDNKFTHISLLNSKKISATDML